MSFSEKTPAKGSAVHNRPLRRGAYRETDIQRWSGGILLLRMVVKAMRKNKFV